MIQFNLVCTDSASSFSLYFVKQTHLQYKWKPTFSVSLQKGGVPAAPSGTATLLRLSPNYRFYPRALLAVTHFRYPRLSWLDGRCVQGPGTYSPQYADLRLLAIPASCRRVAACNPNWDSVFGVCSGSLLRFPLLRAIVVRV